MRRRPLALSKIAGLRLSPEAREQAATAIVEHLKLCRWRFERAEALTTYLGRVKEKP